jgi:hypothetical protein
VLEDRRSPTAARTNTIMHQLKMSSPEIGIAENSKRVVKFLESS